MITLWIKLITSLSFVYCIRHTNSKKLSRLVPWGHFNKFVVRWYFQKRRIGGEGEYERSL